MTKIQSLILGMRKLREAATPGPWRVRIPARAYGIHTQRRIRNESFRVEVPYKVEGSILTESEHRDIGVSSPATFKGPDAEFIAAAPTNQERLERALEIAVEALENIAHTECNAEYKASAQTLEYLRDIRAECEKLKDIEAALGGEL